MPNQSKPRLKLQQKRRQKPKLLPRSQLLPRRLNKLPLKLLLLHLHQQNQPPLLKPHQRLSRKRPITPLVKKARLTSSSKPRRKGISTPNQLETRVSNKVFKLWFRTETPIRNLLRSTSRLRRPALPTRSPKRVPRPFKPRKNTRDSPSSSLRPGRSPITN